MYLESLFLKFKRLAVEQWINYYGCILVYVLFANNESDIQLRNEQRYFSINVFNVSVGW